MGEKFTISQKEIEAATQKEDLKRKMKKRRHNKKEGLRKEKGKKQVSVF